MTTQTEALKLALEALKHGGCPPDCKDGMTDSGGVHPWGEAALIPCPNCQTITAIKEALANHIEDNLAMVAQPEQEPVAIVDANDEGYWADILPDRNVKVGQLLYTTPPQRTWVGLTDEEFAEACQMAERGNYLVAFQRIQAKLKEKNT